MTTASSCEREDSVFVGGGGGNGGGRGANGSYYGDKEGTSWFMYGTSGKRGSGDGRLEEGRGGDEDEGVQMQEWPVGRRDRN